MLALPVLLKENNMATQKNNSGDQPEQSDPNVVKTDDGGQVEAQPNDPHDSPQARSAEAQRAADEQAQRDAAGAAVQERDNTPTEPVVTTTDDDGNQVTLPTSHTGPQELVNGPDQPYNEARPGVSPDWPAARTNDEEHDPGQNDGLTSDEAQRQAQEENSDNQNAPETNDQP